MTNPIEASPQWGRMTALAAITALFLGIFTVSFAAIFIRLSEQEIGPYATIAHRYWIATVALGLWVGFQQFRKNRQDPEVKPSQPLSRREWILLIAAGIIAGLDMSLWALSLTQTSVANAAVLGNLAPVFTTLGTWLIWKQGFDNRFLMGLALALGGAFTLGIEDFQLVPAHLQGDAIALVSAVFFSAYLLTVEQLRVRLSATTVLLGCSAVASIVSTAIALGFEEHFFPTSWQGWLAIMGLALISQTVGQSLVAYSLNQLSSGLVAIAFLLEPVIAAGIAWVLFAETLSILNAVGFSLVIFGIYVAISSQSAIKQATTE